VNVQDPPDSKNQDGDRFSSNWVFVARKAAHLPRDGKHGTMTLSPILPTGKHLWTDKGNKSLTGLVYIDPQIARLRDKAYAMLVPLMNLFISSKELQEYRWIMEAVSDCIHDGLSVLGKHVARTKKYDD
jgi:hypothetical protein